jgi:hypothetical protein
MRRRRAAIATGAVLASSMIGAVAFADQSAQQAFPLLGDWTAPSNLGPPVNSSDEESGPAISDDSRSLYFIAIPIWRA